MTIRTAFVSGIRGVVATVTAHPADRFSVHCANGSDAWHKETRCRVQSAIRNLGTTDRVRIVVETDQGVRPDCGADLAIALCAIGVTGDVLAIGELSLSGAVRPVRGAFCRVLDSGRLVHGDRVICHPSNVGDMAGVLAVDSLTDAIRVARGEQPFTFQLPNPGPMARRCHVPCPPALEPVVDAILGAWAEKRPVILVGPPGAGKTLAVRAAHSRLADACREATRCGTGWCAAHGGADVDEDQRRVYDVAGLSNCPPAVPFRAPHHTCSAAALLGGGAGVVRPGEASLAHGGVLLLDELPEFARNVRDSLRGLLEDRDVTIRGETLPADFSLVATANPCPCGYFATGTKTCACTIGSIQRYRRRWDFGPDWAVVEVKALTRDQFLAAV